MTPEDKQRNAEISRKLHDIDGIQEALKKAARQAVLEHARAGLPIVVWRDGKVVLEDVSDALHEPSTFPQLQPGTMSMSKKLTGKVAVVTGASKGIGAAIAKALAREGASVVVNYATSREGADRVVAEIEKAGGTAAAIQGDVAKAADIERLFAETLSKFGKVDVLVNNAGIYLAAGLGEITEEHFHRQFNLNVLGLILVTQEAIKHMPPEGGVIVNTSSVVSTLSPPGMAVYNATKSAVDNLTRTFAKELAPRKIRVNSVNPGLIATEGTHAIGLVKEGGGASESMGPIGEPAHIASGVVFLASDDSIWMTGQTLYLTGSAG